MFDQTLLEILVCPKCKHGLEHADQPAVEGVEAWLLCRTCAVRFPIRNEIPVLLIEESQPMGA
jgi:uncharacterized protein YbaR (Trm112 family)